MGWRSDIIPVYNFSKTTNGMLSHSDVCASERTLMNGRQFGRIISVLEKCEAEGSQAIYLFREKIKH